MRTHIKLLRVFLFCALLFMAVQFLLSSSKHNHGNDLDLDIDEDGRVISHRVKDIERALMKNLSLLERVEEVLERKARRLGKPSENVHQRARVQAQSMRDDPDSPGYGGRGLTINKEELSPAERERYDQSYEKFKVNEYASNLIPLRRTLINVTEPECLAKLATYDLDKLPTAGVVVVFHNEAWSILLRTVHSILGASSPQLLTEIVLVDDASTMEHLGRQLDDYVDLLDKVKLVRLKQHSGIMQARMAGFHQVTGAVAAFLDSHCEVPEGWLPPLLERVRQDENVLAVPVIDTINTDTFQYHATHAKHQMRAGFDLDLSFMWIPQLPEENARRGSPFEPMRSPSHSGCCFAIAKKTFQRLGLYDPGLKIWSNENTELSLKTWMCGGSVEIIPCSHVGHLFRFASKVGDDPDVVIKNGLRVAEVWMDDYKVLYHDRIYHTQDSFDYGDVSDRVALRQQLGCKSFDWYLKNAYPDMYIPRDIQASGQIQSVENPERCVWTPIHWAKHQTIVVTTQHCNKRDFVQHFTLTKEKQIRRDEGCLDREGDVKFVVRGCSDIADQPGWNYTQEGQVVHLGTGHCLQLEPDDKALVVVPCDGSQRQKWSWERRTLKLPPAT